MLACEPQNAILIMEKMLPLKNEMLQIVRKTRSESYLGAGFEQDLRFQDRQGVAAAIQISLGDDSGFSVFSSDLTAKSKCMLMLGPISLQKDHWSLPSEICVWNRLTRKPGMIGLGCFWICI
jgi:hypothetical protein